MDRYRMTFASNQLATPSVRMVAVEVWLENLDNGLCSREKLFHPVVALSSVVANTFRVKGGLEESETRCSEVLHKAIYVSLRDGCLTEFEEMPTADSAIRLVVCPWPPAADVEELAPVVEAMEKELLDYAARHPATPEAGAR